MKVMMSQVFLVMNLLTLFTTNQVISSLGNPHKLYRSSSLVLFEHVERFRNLKFAVKTITNIQSTVLSFSEGTAAIAIRLAFR